MSLDLFSVLHVAVCKNSQKSIAVLGASSPGISLVAGVNVLLHQCHCLFPLTRASFLHLHQHPKHVIFANLMSKKLSALGFYIPFSMNVVVCGMCSF